MGFKRTIKSRHKRCFVCGHVFKNYNEKNITKIDTKDSHKLSNSVVVCSVCQGNIVNGELILYQRISSFKDLLASLGSRELAEKVRDKIYNTRIKYSKKG